MSLSKKNLDKLNKYKENKNTNNDIYDFSNPAEVHSSDNSNQSQLESKDPNKIFYSLIDNSQTLEETCKVNHSLRKSELNQISINSRKFDLSHKLTTEEELYDEFNYLLDE